MTGMHESSPQEVVVPQPQGLMNSQNEPEMKSTKVNSETTNTVASSYENEIHQLRWRVMKLKHKNRKFKDKLAQVSV
jgi:hypothetical protein